MLAEPSRSGITAARGSRREPSGRPSCARSRARGWALTDEQLAPGIRSVAAPLRDGEGRVIAAMNVTVHAAETPVEVLTGEYLPLLLADRGGDQCRLGGLPGGPARDRPAARCPRALAMP